MSKGKFYTINFTETDLGAKPEDSVEVRNDLISCTIKDEVIDLDVEIGEFSANVICPIHEVAKVLEFAQTISVIAGLFDLSNLTKPNPSNDA